MLHVICSLPQFFNIVLFQGFFKNIHQQDNSVSDGGKSNSCTQQTFRATGNNPYCWGYSNDQNKVLTIMELT